MATKSEDLTRFEVAVGKVTRRTFVKGAAIIATAVASVPLEPLFAGKESVAEASVVDYNSANRANESFNYRKSKAQAQKINVGGQSDNGDIARFPFRLGWRDHQDSLLVLGQILPPLARAGFAAKRNIRVLNERPIPWSTL